MKEIIDFCGKVNSIDINNNHLTIFLWSLVPILSVTVGIHFFIKWINNMDYFPLKERSPLLCIALMVSLLISINIYPSLIISFYYSDGLHDGLFKIYTALFYATKSMSYLIYAIRSLRIVYAYRLQESMRHSTHFVFRFFKNQLIPIGFIALLFVLKLAIVISYSQKAQNWQIAFSSFISKSDNPTENYLFFYRKLFEIFPWQIIIAVCIWIQRKVSREYSIVIQLAWVLGLSLVFSLAEIIAMSTAGTSIIGGMTCSESNLSLQEISLMAHNILLLGVSIIYPVIAHIRYYHTLLPIQQPYDLDNSLKNFLFETRCYIVFYKFLKSLDEEEKGIPYTQYMISWTKIIKCKEQDQPDEGEIQELIQKLQVTNLDSKAILTLNESIAIFKLHSSEHEVQEAANSFNDAIEILSEEIIQHLNIPYKTHFQKTRAYRKLKEIMKDNDRINTNMLMLNMILREQQRID